MTLEEIHQKLRAEFGDVVSELHPALDPFVVVPADRLIDVCAWLRDTPGLDFDSLDDETATDHPDEDLLRVVYHLFSYAHRHSFKLKVELGREAPEVATLTDLWPVANWFEREIHDLFGIGFSGHPDLRPLLLPDDWEGYPMRKDYVEHEGYHGISHVRMSPVEGFARLDALRRKEAEAAAAEAAATELPADAAAEPAEGATDEAPTA